MERALFRGEAPCGFSKLPRARKSPFFVRAREILSQEPVASLVGPRFWSVFQDCDILRCGSFLGKKRQHADLLILGLSNFFALLVYMRSLDERKGLGQCVELWNVEVGCAPFFYAFGSDF